MSQRCKLIGLLTPAQTELLKALFELNVRTGPNRYWRPKDLGAYRSSHHALTLKRLQERGLVERAPLIDSPAHRNFGYRITRSGVETWELFRDVSSMPPHAVFGDDSTRARIETCARLAS